MDGSVVKIMNSSNVFLLYKGYVEGLEEGENLSGPRLEKDKLSITLRI